MLRKNSQLKHINNIILNYEEFIVYADAKLILLTISFIDIEEYKSGNSIGFYTYQPYVAVTNSTTPYEYWKLVQSNVINKFIDNSYENNIPLWVSVRVVNSCFLQ